MGSDTICKVEQMSPIRVDNLSSIIDYWYTSLLKLCKDENKVIELPREAMIYTMIESGVLSSKEVINNFNLKRVYGKENERFNNAFNRIAGVSYFLNKEKHRDLAICSAIAYVGDDCLFEMFFDKLPKMLDSFVRNKASNRILMLSGLITGMLMPVEDCTIEHSNYAVYCVEKIKPITVKNFIQAVTSDKEPELMDCALKYVHTGKAAYLNPGVDQLSCDVSKLLICVQDWQQFVGCEQYMNGNSDTFVEKLKKAEEKNVEIKESLEKLKNENKEAKKEIKSLNKAIKEYKAIEESLIEKDKEIKQLKETVRLLSVRLNSNQCKV